MKGLRHLDLNLPWLVADNYVVRNRVCNNMGKLSFTLLYRANFKMENRLINMHPTLYDYAISSTVGSL